MTEFASWFSSKSDYIRAKYLKRFPKILVIFKFKWLLLVVSLALANYSYELSSVDKICKLVLTEFRARQSQGFANSPILTEFRAKDSQMENYKLLLSVVF